MATVTIKYGTDADLTVTNLHSLASSASLLAGWTSASVSNTSTLAVDYHISGQFQVSTTAPTDNTSILVFAYSADDDTPNWPDLFSAGTEGTEGTASVHTDDVRNSGLVLLWSTNIGAATSQVYTMPKTSLAQHFDGVCPHHWCIWVTQDTGQALAASGNSITYMPIKYDSA